MIEMLVNGIAMVGFTALVVVGVAVLNIWMFNGLNKFRLTDDSEDDK